MMRSSMQESNLPPVRIHLVFENRGDKPVKLRLWEFSSELGNFALRPEYLQIEPGKSASPEGMTSRLGLTSAALPVTLELRLEGKAERKVIKLSPAPIDEDMLAPPPRKE